MSPSFPSLLKYSLIKEAFVTSSCDMASLITLYSQISLYDGYNNLIFKILLCF